MNTEKKPLIFLVDDDALLLKSLEIDFNWQSDFTVLAFPSGELCIENLFLSPDLVILDYHLDGINTDAMNGIEVLDKIKSVNSEIPVIMLSSQDKIEVAVNCMRHKAVDYVVKSETAFMRLQKTIAAVFQHKKMEKQLSWYMDRM